jgi:hypothetical protein
MFIQTVEDRDENKEAEEKNNDQRGFADRLAVEAGEIGFDPGKPVFHRSEHAHGLSF